MASLTEIRQQYPQYNDMSDRQLADALHGKFYSDIPKKDYYAALGLTAEDRENYSLMEKINNAVNQLGTGAYKAIAGTVGMPGDLAAAGQAAPMPGPIGNSKIDVLKAENEQRRRAAGNIFPTGQEILAAAENYVPGFKMAPAETRGDKFLQAGGSGATGAFFPGGALPNFVGGVSGGVASEGAGQLTEGTALEPYARIAAGLAGGVAGSLGVNRLAASNAEQLISGATQGVTPDQWAAAMRLQSEAARRGTPITSAEALAQVQGGNRSLMSLQRSVEQMPDSAPQMDAFMSQRPAGSRAATESQLTQIAPRPLGPTEVGPQIQRGAQDYIDDVRQGINAQTDDLYTLSRDAALPDEVFQRLNADPVFQQHLAAVRAEPLLNRRVADLPDNSVGVINQVKKSMDEAQAGFSNPMRETYSPERGSNLGDVQRPMVQAAREAAPTYDIALDTQEMLRRTQLAPAERAPIGQLAQTDDVKQQAGILLPKESLKASPEQIGGTVRELVNQGQTAAVQDLLRLKLQDAFDTALSNVKGTTEQYRGAQFANNLLKNNNQAQSLEAAVRALPNGDTQWVGLRRLLDVFEAQGQRLLPGSPTSFNQQLAGDMAKNLGKGVKSLGTDIWANWNIQRRSQELARVLTAPEGVALLRQLAVTGPNTARAQQLVQGFYQGAQGARSSEPAIDIRRARATPSLQQAPQ
jgi:hypothetical protein